MVSNLVENLTRDVMLELAGESYFERGEDYHRGGHVHDLVEHAGVVVARVAGTEDYRVRLWAEDDLVFSCDCPLGLDGEFCTHSFAEGFFHLVVPLEVEVNEVAVGAAIDSPAHDPALILALDEIAVLTERDVRRSTQPQILVVEVRARYHAPDTVEVHVHDSTLREFFHSGGVSDGYKVGFVARCLLHSVAKILRDIYPA